MREYAQQAMELSDPAFDITALREAAQAARVMNWAPYSKYVVIAAVETIDGKVFGGSNVENANFTLTKHAEETAVIAALADGAMARCRTRQWLKVIYTLSEGDSAPCGGCRQFIAEFAADDAVWVADKPSGQLVRPFWDLLPLDFGPRHLDV